MKLMDNLKTAITDFLQKTSDLFHHSADPLVTAVREVDAATPMLRELGYFVKEIKVAVALVPAVTLTLTREFEPTEQQFDQALQKHTDNLTLGTIIRLLKQTNALQNRLQLKHHHCNEFEITLSVPPSIELIFGDPVQPRRFSFWRRWFRWFS